MRCLGLGSLRAIRLSRMSNKYHIGYMAERRARHTLEGWGYNVLRSAGSKGPFDLIAFNRKEFVLIQIKVCPFSKMPAFGTLKRQIKEIAAPDNCEKQLWVWEKSRGWHYFKI